MKSFPKTTVAVALTLALAWLAPSVARAQVLKQVPSDAIAVIKVNNLQSTSQKIGKLMQQWGIAQMSPEAADPLGALKQKLNITEGLKADGEFAMAFVDPPGGGKKGEPQFVMLIPVSDYKKFLGNFQDTKNEGDITEAPLPDGEPVFVAKWGDYAAVSHIKQLVMEKPKKQGITPAGFAAKELQSKDIVTYFNMPAIREKALPELKGNREKVLKRFHAQMAKGKAENKKFEPVIDVAINQVLDGVEQFLTDAQSATWGVALSDAGINYTVATEFGDKTPFGSRIAQIKNTDAHLLQGLPQGQYLAYGGTSFDPKVVGKIVDDLLDPTMKELKKVEDAKPIIDYLSALQDATKAQSGQTFGVVTPTGPVGQESLLQIISVTSGDAKALIAAQKQMFQSQQDMMKLLGGAEQAQVTTTYTANAKTVDGVQLDQLQTQFNLNPQTPQEAQAAQMLSFFYGPNGMNAFIGSTDPKHVIAVVGGNDALIKKAIDGAKKNEAPLASSPALKSVTQKLPQQRVVAVYVGLDEIVKTAVNAAKQFGMPIQLQLPPNLSPVGMTVATDGPAVRVDGYVPSQTIQSIVAAGMQAFMQMRGGGGMGGGGDGGGL
jgi:hypothetical protein